MEAQLSAPDVVATEVPIGQLEGTAKSLVQAAQAAGWTVKATRSLGPRIPKLRSQGVERVTTLALIGMMEQWRFVAYWNVRDGWDVVLARPGWGLAPSNTTELRNVFRAQTPKKVA